MTNFLSRRYSSRIALGIFKRLTGQRGVGIQSSDISQASTDVMRADAPMTANAVEALTAMSADEAYDATPYAVNDDPYKIRFRKMGITRIKRMWRRFVEFIKNVLAFIADLRSEKFTSGEKMVMLSKMRRWHPDDLDEHRRTKQEREIFMLHKKPAKLIEERIIEKLTQLRFCHFVTKNDQVHVKKRIKFGYANISPFAYVYMVQTLPFGVKMTEIAQEWVTNELSATVNKKVRIELNQWGLRITVEVASTLSIPNFVQFKDMIDNFPKTAAPLAFAVGMTTNGSPVYRNLADAPHMIIAGSTGGGKSNSENVILTSILHRNDPRLVKCVLFDMKGGVEFNYYEGIPHLLQMSMPEKIGKEKDGTEKVIRRAWSQDGIIERKHDVIPALEWLLAECERRLAIIKNAKVKNIQEYNRGKRIDKKLPHIVVGFDEWAVIRKSEFGKEAQMLVGELGNISRSTGYNIILCTQYPNAEILDPTISVNFDWRLAFNMTTGASQSVLGGSWDAAGLYPVGRAIFHTSEGNLQVQTPRITNGNIEAIVEGIKTGATNVAGMMGVDLIEIFQWSLNNASGKLDVETVFNQYRERISKDNIRSLLKSSDGKIYDVQGTLYKVVNTVGGQRARHLELAEGEGLTAENTDSSIPNAGTTPVTDTVPMSFECDNCGAPTASDPCEYCHQPIAMKG
jgi:S-DNA-T family DNA segregation ATPase FtsK/SpoIIIE